MGYSGCFCLSHPGSVAHGGDPQPGSVPRDGGNSKYKEKEM